MTFDPTVGLRGVARLDVVAPTPNAQQVTFFSKNINFPQSAHRANFSNPAATAWQFSNVGTTPHTFGVGDRIDITEPGSSAVVRTLSLTGFTVQPGTAQDVLLPIAGRTPGPYTVTAHFFDPGVGAVVTTRSGIRDFDSLVDLHRLGKREIGPGETVEFGITFVNFPLGVPAPSYFLMFGGAPGTTPLPGGGTLPLALDGLVNASLAGIVPGLVGNIGTVPNQIPSPLFFHGTVRGITMTHPSIPAASGLTLRVGVLGLDQGLTVWEGSQPEEIVLL